MYHKLYSIYLIIKELAESEPQKVSIWLLVPALSAAISNTSKSARVVAILLNNHKHMS